MYVLIRKIYKILKNFLQGNFRGVYTEIHRPLKNFHRKYILPLLVFRTRRKIINIIAQESSGKRVIIFPHTLDWNMALFQRPQQLAVAYSKKPNSLVLYLTKNYENDNIQIAEKVSRNLWVVNDNVVPALWKRLKAKETIMSLSWTVNKDYFYKLKPDYLIYEFIDELEIFNGYNKQMEIDHKELARRADLVVCTASKLFEQAKRYASNPLLSTNAGDYDLFSKTTQFAISPLIKSQISSYSCVLGYYGALAKWFDYGLIRETALQCPEWLWILVGMDYDGSLIKSGILHLRNVLYIPPQEYKTLPCFLKAFTIATIPFVINDVTLSTSPVKLFEYMAAGKPILTSKMPECLKYKSVYTYIDAEDFICKANELLQLQKDDMYWQNLKADALANTWDVKTDEILKALYLSKTQLKNTNYSCQQS